MRKQSLRTQPAAKMKMRLSTRYIVTGVALIVIVVSIGTFLFLNLGNSRDAMAAPTVTLTAVNGGNWSTAATWTLSNGAAARVPAAGDIIEIPVNKTVNITSNVSFALASVEVLNIKGLLNFSNAYDVILGTTSSVNIFPTGNITDGNGSSRLYIGGTMIYKGNKGIIGGFVPPTTCATGGCFSNITLPIRLVSFTAQKTAKGVELNWVTAQEENNAFFTIEKSTDAAKFTALQKVKGAGTSSEKLSYQAIDQNKIAGLIYYRLRQTDIDGKTTVSKIVSVNNDGQGTEISTGTTSDQTMEETASLTVNKVGPNPFIQDFFVDFDLVSEGLVAVQLTDMQGRVVETKSIDGVEGNNRYEFVDTQGLTPGIYIFSMKHQHTSKVIRLMKR
ncbi:MAG: T9SS type A sorting domain-containing protein [Bacteroidota bacterium]